MERIEILVSDKIYASKGLSAICEIIVKVLKEFVPLF